MTVFMLEFVLKLESTETKETMEDVDNTGISYNNTAPVIVFTAVFNMAFTSFATTIVLVHVRIAVCVQCSQ